MLRLFTCAMALGFLSLTWAARPARKAAAKSAKSSSSKTKSASARKGSGKKALAKSASWRNRQLAPTPARYREIQQALAAKGFLRPEDATGVWSQTSVEGLKRFQAAQNIEASGKINSLSLIALGLGPKRDTAVAKPPAPPPGR